MGQGGDLERPVFTAPDGAFRGWADDAGGVDRATGIRYAEAERFRRPRPVAPHTSPVEATGWSPACPQPLDLLPDGMVGDTMGDLVQDEHCQGLSVALPRGARAGANLPVMVWVHGGANLIGAGDSPLYDPAPLVLEQEVVVVNVTYRLGVLGFLGGEDRPANLGLFDLLEAFRWVQRNIASFGGDPARVTAFGESAGADAIAHLMIAHGGRGLFHRAVLMSPPLGLRHGRDAIVERLAERAAAVDLQGEAGEVASAFRQLARGALRHGLSAAMPFGIQYGRPPLPPEAEAAAAWRAVAPAVEVLIGSNAREMALFLPHLAPLRVARKVPVAGERVTEGLVERLSDRVYGDDIREFAERHRSGGGRALLYVLRTGLPGERYESAHATDIPLLFPTRHIWDGSPMLGGVPWDQVVETGRALRAAWADFARTGGVDPVLAPEGLTVEDQDRTGREG